MSNQTNPTIVTTGQVRLSYEHLLRPYASKPDQEPKYSTTILIPKSDIATKQRLDAAIQAAIQASIPKVWGGTRYPQIAIPIHDGDGPRPSDGMPFGEECRGHWVMTASSKQQPAIVDLNMNPIINPTEIYSGIYARVNVNFFGYKNTKVGIGCGLGPVQKLSDGEPLGGGRVSPEEAFGAQQPGIQAPAQLGYPQQNYPQQPNAYTQQPGYPSNVIQYPGQFQSPPQPAYVQQPPQMPPNMQYAPQQPVQLDPITGKPIIGGVMGL